MDFGISQQARTYKELALLDAKDLEMLYGTRFPEKTVGKVETGADNNRRRRSVKARQRVFPKEFDVRRE